MHDARDAEDALLLAAGDHAVLLAAYADVVVQRCLVATRDEAGYDVAQNVFLRLWQELGRGKRYPVPYRRVVHNVIDWTLKEHMDGLEIQEIADRLGKTRNAVDQALHRAHDKLRSLIVDG